jgi:hypothetical protein
MQLCLYYAVAHSLPSVLCCDGCDHTHSQHSLKERLAEATFDVVSCPAGRLGSVWADGTRAFNFLHNAATALKVGGLFIGSVHGSAPQRVAGAGQ